MPGGARGVPYDAANTEIFHPPEVLPEVTADSTPAVDWSTESYYGGRGEQGPRWRGRDQDLSCRGKTTETGCLFDVSVAAA